MHAAKMKAPETATQLKVSERSVYRVIADNRADHAGQVAAVVDGLAA
jgi:hypothetical protein